MQGDVVCDTSPLIFLAKIKRLGFLDIYSLYVPSQVETDRKTLEAISLELIEKGYRIKEELLVEFLKRVKGLD